MKVSQRNQHILCAYAILFTVAGGIVLLDPVQRRTQEQLEDAPLPQMTAEFTPAAPEPPLPLTGTLAAQLTTAAATAPR